MRTTHCSTQEHPPDSSRPKISVRRAAAILTFVVTMSAPPIGVAAIEAQQLVERPAATDRFDLAMTTLAANYSGVSIEQLVQSLTTPPRSEFETAAEYAARTPKLEAGALYAFVLTAPNLQIDYVPDREHFEIVFNEDRGVVYDLSRRLGSRAITIKRSDVLDRTYLGGNAFGANRTVQRYIADIYSIVFDRPGREATLTERTHRIELPVSRDRAELLKRRLRVLVICHGYAGPQPQVFEGSESSAPTLNSPSEVQTHYHYLQVGDVAAVWIFDGSTGEIFAR